MLATAERQSSQFCCLRAVFWPSLLSSRRFLVTLSRVFGELHSAPSHTKTTLRSSRIPCSWFVILHLQVNNFLISSLFLHFQRSARLRMQPAESLVCYQKNWRKVVQPQQFKRQTRVLRRYLSEVHLRHSSLRPSIFLHSVWFTAPSWNSWKSKDIAFSSLKEHCQLPKRTLQQVRRILWSQIFWSFAQF